MEDAMGQEIQLGDLVVAKLGGRYSTVLPARVVRIGERRIRVAKVETWRIDKYKVTGSINPINVVVIEREFVQPNIKDKLASWNGSSKKKLHDVLGCPADFVVQWIQTRCTSLEA